MRVNLLTVLTVFMLAGVLASIIQTFPTSAVHSDATWGPTHLAAVKSSTDESAPPGTKLVCPEEGDDFCAFLAKDYGEEWNVSILGTDLPDGYCLDRERPQWRSYKNHSSAEGYFYEGDNCDGRSLPVTHHSENPDIGFDAHSFKYACVSCGPRQKK